MQYRRIQYRRRPKFSLLAAPALGLGLDALLRPGIPSSLAGAIRALAEQVGIFSRVLGGLFELRWQRRACGLPDRAALWVIAQRKNWSRLGDAHRHVSLGLPVADALLYSSRFSRRRLVSAMARSIGPVIYRIESATSALVSESGAGKQRSLSASETRPLLEMSAVMPTTARQRSRTGLDDLDPLRVSTSGACSTLRRPARACFSVVLGHLLGQHRDRRAYGRRTGRDVVGDLY